MPAVRFAPSPTGFLHIGGVRTALFNYLYAKNQKGQFFLRIEDTDLERSKKEYEEEILESMKWLGLDHDGEIVRQSERLERYREYANSLVEQGLAYTEKNEEGKEAVRFKMPEKKAVFYDLVRDKVEFDAGLFDDLVIMKSDGFPTYHWACVVDDHEMGMTHIIRGDDHLSNTPRQILLYEAMGWKPPKYAHLPLIVGADMTPLSKRHGAVSLSAFRKKGYLPEAILNYLALLGWGSGDNQELFTLDELIKKFSLKRINKANAQFNGEKLDWVNSQHIKRMPDEEYLKAITEALGEKSEAFEPQAWKKLVLLYKTRIKTFPDLEQQAHYCFKDPDQRQYDESKCREFFSEEKLAVRLEALIEALEESDSFGDDQALEAQTRAVAEALGCQAKDLIHPLRFSISSETVTPGLFELMSVLGKETCLRRLRFFLEFGAKSL